MLLLPPPSLPELLTVRAAAKAQGRRPGPAPARPLGPGPALLPLPPCANPGGGRVLCEGEALAQGGLWWQGQRDGCCVTVCIPNLGQRSPFVQLVPLPDQQRAASARVFPEELPTGRGDVVFSR